MKGFRTLAFAAMLAAASAALTQLSQVDWTQYASPRLAGLVGIGISAAITALRLATSTPVGQAVHPAEKQDSNAQK